MKLPTDVHVWQLDVESAAPVPLSELNAEERERTARRRSAAGRRWAASRWGLRLVLARYLDQPPGQIELVLGEHGKPALAGAEPALEFNLSHSGGLALIAVAAAHPVGIDIEQIAPRKDFAALAERQLGASVAAELRRAPAEQRAAIFYTAWARHEARLKCHGGGLGGPPPPGPVAVSDVRVAATYRAALAAPGSTPPPFTLYRLDLS